jgi:hypothetical protein
MSSVHFPFPDVNQRKVFGDVSETQMDLDMVSSHEVQDILAEKQVY